MTELTKNEIQQIRSALSRLEGNPIFAQAPRMLRFLHYVVEEVLAGHGDRLTQFALGIDVFDRGENFDPAFDSVVRVEASRLRNKLREYYSTNGKGDGVRFDLPKGTYVPEIRIGADRDKIKSSSEAELASIRAYGSAGASVDSRHDVPGNYSLVVLPFEPLASDPSAGELADAVTTEIIDRLGRAVSFEVVSRRTAFTYQGRNIDVRQVGRELNVSYVLEGSLRKLGSHVRIAVALTDALSGRQLWTESYDREQADPFELQDDIGRAVLASLGGVLWRVATADAHRLPPDRLDATELTHRATHMFFNYSRHTLRESKALVQRAVEQEPELAYGHALLAFLWTHKAINCWADSKRDLYAEALAAVDQAVELGPSDTSVLALASQSLMWLGDPGRAFALVERAVTLEPENLPNKARLGNALVHFGKAEKGLEHIDTAINLGPKEHIAPPWHYHFRAHALNQLGQYEKAEESAQIAVDVMGGAPPPWFVYVNALAENGKLQQAHAALAELRRLSPQMTFEHLERVFQTAYVSEENAERHLAGLRKLDWN
ncbi:MAG: hypothetical protein V3R53_03485 [Gammaproteobacteria bacterium]